MPDESLFQTVKRNITPEADSSRAALGPGHEFENNSPQAEGEQQYKEKFGSPLERAYGHVKGFLSEHEHHLSEAVLKPFRKGLDNMAEDLQSAAESGHTKSGGQMTGPTRALAAGTAAALKMVPVGGDVKETAAGLIVPPEFGPEERATLKSEKVLDFSKLAGHKEAKVLDFSKLEGHSVITPGGSGESAASQEAINRVASEKANKISRVSIDTRSGAETPLIGVDAVDAKPATPYHTVVERGPKGETVVSEGEKARALPKKPTPKEIVEKQGLKYKGELSPGSGVHMFEHPDHPGKTAALNEHQITPGNVKEKMQSKIKEFTKNIDFKATPKNAKLPESDKKTLTPKYLLGHENHFDPNTYTPEQLLEKGVLTGMKPVSKT